MASWAQAASPSSATTTKANYMSVSNKNMELHTRETKKAVSKSTKSRNSNLVAVPSLALLPKATARTGAASSSLNTTTTNSTSQTGSILNVLSPNTNAEKATNASNHASSGSVSWEYDVYATPFVPSEWRTINLEEPNFTINTTSRHRLDYPGYVTTFAGTSLLPQPMGPARQDHHEAHHSPRLTVQSYRSYFTPLWNHERVAKEHENQEHWLFKVPLYSKPVPNEDPI
jgi:hypothetical protein